MNNIYSALHGIHLNWFPATNSWQINEFGGLSITKFTPTSVIYISELSR